jgi:hypothetical protein
MLPRRRHALADLPRFLFRHRCQNIGDKLRYLTTFRDGVDLDPQAVQLLPGSRPLKHAAPETVQPLHDHRHAMSLRAHTPDVCEQCPVLRTIIALARHDVLKLATDDPPVRGRVAPAVGDLGWETESFALLFVS